MNALSADAIAGISAAIGEATGTRFKADAASPVGGGSIHRAWRIADGARHYFVKTGDGSAAPMFAAEAEGLRALAATAVLRTPTFVATGQCDGLSYLVLDHIQLDALDRDAAARLGTALARLHRVTGDNFGWAADNYIGTSPQHNGGHPDWPHFFGTRRLQPQLRLAIERGMDKALVARGMSLIEGIGGLFIDYWPRPSLLHGDLWSGNAARCDDGEPVIFDPACYYGDRETDLAMTELFGGFPTSFYAAYRNEWPLDPGYEERKPLYNLYHILNHFNLFGDAYLGQVQRMTDALLKRIRR